MPRRFAPLKEGSAASSSGLPKLRGIVFDVDGTLCEPQNYMFGEMRAALGISKSVDILDHIYSLPSSGKGGTGAPGSAKATSPPSHPTIQEDAMEAVRDIERRAMVKQTAQPGLVELMAWLDGKGVRKGICTRNFDTPVAHLLDKFLSGSVFGPIVTREFRPPKPDPAGILHIAQNWGLLTGAQQAPDASGLIMVGDSIDDMTAGRRAGAATVLLVNDVNRHLAEHEHTDLVIDQLDQLIGVLDDGFVGRAV